MGGHRDSLRKLGWVVGAGAAVATYMHFEAQWVDCGQANLVVPGLPSPWSGLRVLHLSDVHAGLFLSNERSLQKVVRWAIPLAPDIVFLTGDMLGNPRGNTTCLELLAHLRPPLGTYAVTGNHEYGIGKGPLARSRDASRLWDQADITLLDDQCVSLPGRDGTRITICGADYRSGGFGLLNETPSDINREQRTADATDDFPILLIHEPPAPDSPLGERFPLAFAGHTHGGQLRRPGRGGLTPLHKENNKYLGGVYKWGRGFLVVSRGVGTSFVPFRLLTRPEATLWRLV